MKPCSVTPSSSGLFPLPLVVFEEYMLDDDRVEYPMDCFFVLHCFGVFDRSRLELAVQQTVARHPLLSATVRARALRRLEWVESTAPPSLHFDSTGPLRPRTQAIPRLDLFREPGLRVWVVSEGERTDLIFEFHHACCDGLGIAQFGEEVVVAYINTGRGTDEQFELLPTDAELLRHRGVFDMRNRPSVPLMARFFMAIRCARDFSRRRPLALGGPRPGIPSGGRSPRVLYIRWEASAEETIRIGAAARALHTTVNLLLIRDLFLTLGAWTARHQSAREDDYIRMVVPMSLRSRTDLRMSACNRMSMLFLDRQIRQLQDPRDLLTGIHDDMRTIKAYRLDRSFIRSLRVARHLPGGINRASRHLNCAGTAVFSNLCIHHADVRAAGRGSASPGGMPKVESIDALGPLRRGTAAGFLLTKYPSRYVVTLRYDERRLSAEQSNELLESFRWRLLQSMGEALEP